MLANQVTTLRAALRSASMDDPDSFSRVFSAFFDISEGPELIDACELVEDPVIRAIVESAARSHARDPKLALLGCQILHHGSTGLFHGSCFVARFVGTFFYFADEQQGLVAFHDGTAMTHYYRISATVLPPGTMPMRRPPGKH